jgi:hypothetical protein
MNDKLYELEQTTHHLFEGGVECPNRTSFDIGVEFGKEIQRQQRHDYEFLFWKSLIEESTLRVKRDFAYGRISDLLLTLVRASVRDHLVENEVWRVGSRDYTSQFDDFSDKTLEKFCVQIIHVDRVESGKLRCTFKVVGRLAKAFEKHGFSQQFSTSVINDFVPSYTDVSRFCDLCELIPDAQCHIQESKALSVDQLWALHTAIINEFPVDKT